MRVWLRQQFQTGVLSVFDVLLFGCLVLTLTTLVLVNLDIGKDERGAAGPPRGRSVAVQPPSDAPPVGTFTRSFVTPQGDLRVQQWIRSDRPLDALTLRAPSEVRSARTSRMTVAADGVLVPGIKNVAGADRRITLADPATTVYVAYILRGVVEVSPSQSGRALARATALRVTHRPSGGPSHVVVKAPKVLTAACSTSRSPTPVPCGTPTGRHGWTVVLHGAQRQASVMAQVDLG